MSEKLEERKIVAWFTQVYPDTVELSMATKNLNEVMEDTALLIANLKGQLVACQKELEIAKEKLSMVSVLHEYCQKYKIGHGGENVYQLTVDDAERLRKELAAKEKELAEAKQWVKDLQSGMFINCVYCGHRYGPKDEVPASMADVLKAHIEICPKHPMSQLKKELAKAKAKIRNLIVVCKMAYEKHHKNNPDIGWDELSNELLDVLENYQSGLAIQPYSDFKRTNP